MLIIEATLVLLTIRDEERISDEAILGVGRELDLEESRLEIQEKPP